MDELRPQYDDEIDLVELMQTVWDGKWQIVSFVVASVATIFGYQLVQPPPKFISTTEIKLLSSVQAERYRESNAVGFFEITPETLLNLYVEQLEDGTLLSEAIDDFGLIPRDKFADQQEYADAVTALTAEVQLLPPINQDGSAKGDSRRFWTLTFEHHDEDAWKNALASVHQFASEEVRRTVHRRFETSLSVAKLQREFELEDATTQILNLRSDYERKTSDKLAYLREQAQIARKLDVAKNTIEAQTFSTQSGMVANVKTDTPFYLRGYEAIEKEIQLIETRKETDAFVAGLLELEQKVRSINQDKTLERAEALFSDTPVIQDQRFAAVSVAIEATKFEYQNKRMLMIALAIVVGGMIGILYVLIRSAMTKRNQSYA